jgi:LacI family transcriptional regulator
MSQTNSRATIHDIARMVSVSASTVSRALRNDTRISSLVRETVWRAASELDYRPNHIAAALRNGRSNILGVIVPTADRTFFSSVIRGIEEIANASGLHILICQTYDSYTKEIATVEALLNARVDGIIASHAKETVNFEHFLKVKKRGVPLLFFDRSRDDIGVSQVVIDDYYGAYKATEHLIREGCRRIAHFTGPFSISIYKDRFRGYCDALSYYGVPRNPDYTIESSLQLEDGRNSMSMLLELSEPPDAVFSSSAIGIMGALQVCKERSVPIPEQIALVGFSDEPYLSFCEPGITTIDQKSMTIGNTAAKLILQPASLHDARKIVLRPELVVRRSSLRTGSGILSRPT